MQRFAVLPLLFASACIGSITGSESDPTEPPPPPPPEPVTEVRITVRDGSHVKAGVKVVFQDASDNVIADTTTDASGAASAKMPDGGSVSVIREYGPNVYGEPGPIDHVYTYVGVKPGDILDLRGDVHDGTPYYAKVNVGLTNGEFVGVLTGCGSGYGHAPVIDVELRNCGSETDFFVINYSGETDDQGVNSGPLYFATHANLAPEIDFSGETFRGTLTTEFSATNLPSMAVNLQKRLASGKLTMFDSGLVGTTATTDVPELPTVDQVVSARVDDYAGHTMVISSRLAFTSAPVAIDIAANVIQTSHVPTLAGSLLAWTEEGTPGTPDLSLATITVGAVDRQFSRTIAAPYTGASLRVPALPAAHDAYNVRSTDTPRITHQLVRVTGGYDGARARVFDQAQTDIAPIGGIATVTAPAIAGPQ